MQASRDLSVMAPTAVLSDNESIRNKHPETEDISRRQKIILRSVRKIRSYRSYIEYHNTTEYQQDTSFDAIYATRY